MLWTVVLHKKGLQAAGSYSNEPPNTSQAFTHTESSPERLVSCIISPDRPMADKEDRNPENVPGEFYVDSQCIDCDLCRDTAPNNFTREEDEGYSYVYKQPENDDEREQCVEAMEGCPVEAIGEDGA